MDKVQKIREEIERQIEFGKTKCQQSQENNDQESYIAWSEHIATCGKLLLFIDSLPEEHNEDLEEAAAAFYDNCNIAKSSWWDEGILHKMSESKETFIAGAEWKEKEMIEKACNWIKENKHKYIKLHSMKLMVDDSIIEDFKKAIKEN